MRLRDPFRTKAICGHSNLSCDRLFQTGQHGVRKMHPQSILSSVQNFSRARICHPSPQADRRTLIRRVYFDLIGLPPAPNEVDAFVADQDQAAYEKLVDRLLNSPRYGERWARHWIDAAHFAETHGHDQDRIREHAWPYRDYLIAALNADVPYGQFIEQQIAADVVDPDDPSLTPALGFVAAGPWDESSLRDIREDSIDRQIADISIVTTCLTTVISNVSSLTIQCARCHDHKFDPISQRDYYALQAVFSGVERANRRYDVDSQVYRQRMALVRQKSELEQRQQSAMASLLADDKQRRVVDWEHQHAAQVVQWKTVVTESFTSAEGATLTKIEDGSILSEWIATRKRHCHNCDRSTEPDLCLAEPNTTASDGDSSRRVDGRPSSTAGSGATRQWEFSPD